MSKEELPEDLKKLSMLKEEYTEFQDKATRAGVPRDIREPEGVDFLPEVEREYVSSCLAKLQGNTARGSGFLKYQ
jgi:hypothetical protein